MKLVNAPAKINLALHITGKRDDGYHLIDTLTVFAKTINACDTVIASKSDRDGFTVAGPRCAPLIQDDAGENLAVAARDKLRLMTITAGSAAPAVHISLEKRLPVAAGLGGGSADAAATIIALSQLWGSTEETKGNALLEMATELGADVPMCMFGRPVRAQGIGERLSIIKEIPALHLVLVNCGKEVSTPAVFEALESKENDAIGELPNSDDFTSWLAEQTRNDLHAPAAEICPAIDKSLKALDKQGAKLSRMSGSGATCFGLFDNATDARIAAEAISKAEPKWWVEPTHTEAMARG